MATRTSRDVRLESAKWVKAHSFIKMQVVQIARGFKAKSQVSTWLLAIARNKALSAMRARLDEQLDDEMATAIVDPADDAETTVNKRDRSAIVQRCLSQLSPSHREVIDLVYYHEKSIDEVARIVGAPENTVKTRMFYARRRMETLLKTAGLAS